MIAIDVRAPLHLIFIRRCGRLVPPGRSSASKDAELLMLRHDAAVPASSSATSMCGSDSPCGVP
jgi:hypothetical protein